MADVAAVLDTAGLAGLHAGKKGQKKPGGGQDPAGFVVAMIAQMVASDVAKVKPSTAVDGQAGFPVPAMGPAGRAGEPMPLARADKPEAAAPPSDGQEAPAGDMAGIQVQALASAHVPEKPSTDPDPAAAVQPDARVARLSPQASGGPPAQAVEGVDAEAAQEAEVPASLPTTPQARAGQAMVAHLAREMPETAAAERPQLAHASGASANAADTAGKAGQVLPLRVDAMSQNPQQTLQDNANDATGDSLAPNAPATPSGTTDAAMVRPFDHVLRQVEARFNVAVEAPVRTPAFVTELGEKVVWLASRNTQVAELTLNPPQMGTLEVRLAVTGGEAGAQFFSPNPVVREALEAALPKLRELMAQAGINLGEANVRDQAFAQDRSVERFPARTAPSFASVEATVESGPRGPLRSAGFGMVDLYA